MPYRGIGPGGSTVRRTGTTRRYRGQASAAPPAPKAAPHRSFFGGLVHDITHPGVPEIAAALSPITIPSYLAAHSHVPGLTQAGRVGQVLLTSPHHVIAHPGAAARNLGGMVVGLGELPYAIPKSVMDQGFHKTVANLWKGIRDDYARRYGANWEAAARKDPLFNLADALMVAGPATKAASIAGAARTLGRVSRAGEAGLALGERGALIKGGRATEWAKLSPREKLRIARAESKQPGKFTTGTAKTRRVAAKLSAEGEPLAIEQPLSSTPMRRAVQQAFDDISRAYPDMPGLGAGARTVRATARQLSRATDRVLATIPGAEKLQKIGSAGRARAFWEANLVPHQVDDAGNIIHDHGAVTAKLTELRDALSREYSDPAWKLKLAGDSPELADALDAARRRGYGKPLIKELEDAIKYKPGKDYEQSIEALKHASTVGEQIIHDTEGFSTLRNTQHRLRDRLEVLGDNPAHADEVASIHDQLANVSEQLANKRIAIQDMLVNRRRAVPEYLATAPVDAPERGAWERHMVSLGWTPQQASDALRISDLRARAVYPENPARYYADQIGTPSGETAQQMLSRVGTHGAYWQDGPKPLIEGDVLAPAPDSPYYSKAQKALAGAGWGKDGAMPKEQLQNWMRKAETVGPDEYANANLDLFFDQYPAGARIPKTALQEHLATPLNQFNIHERHWTNTPGMHNTEFDHPWEYGDGQSSDLVSRTPGPGEYHEIVMHLPDDKLGPWYAGTGAYHFRGMNDVVGHVRFQVFDEGGVKKLVVEEIQSDWLSDFRKRATTLHPPMNERRWNELAVNRILRHAGENGVDEVIIPEAHLQHARGASGDFLDDMERARVWGEAGLSGKTIPEARARIEQIVGPGDTSFKRLYEREHPKTAAKRLGVKGEMTDSAYRGYIAGAAERTQVGDMRGTVFKLDDAARAKAREPSALYQQQPEWGKLPRGANEVLANGKRVIHLFQNADISTWMHELSHSAVHDLSEADQAILNEHYGEGAASIEKWANAAHENYARDFERYIREGKLPESRALQDVFERIQEWMTRVYRAVTAEAPKADIPPDVEDVFRRMFVPEHDTPDIFMPHRATAPNLAGARMASGAPRATRTIGTEVQPRIPLFKRNRLGLLRSGMLNTDPRQLFEHVNRLLSLQKANQVREFLLEHGQPLLHPDDFDPRTQYVVKEAGTNPNKVLFDAISNAEHPDEIRQTVKDFVDNNVLDSRDKVEAAWKGDQQLYVVDKGIVDSLFKYVTGKKPGQATKPMGLPGQLGDALANSIRGLLLYGNPGFYVANMVGNLGMQLFNDPRSVRYLKDALTKRGDLYHRVSVEMGRGPTSAATADVPHILGREVRPLGAGRNAVVRTANAAEWWNHQLGQIGRKTGALVDDPFRYATWRQEARKLGYKTDEQVRKLLDQAVADTRKHGMGATGTKALNDLNKIRDRAEQLMLDFDSMTPFERNWLTRVIFLYPFLKASAKYPVMFAAEHPFTWGALAQGSNVGEQYASSVLGPRPDLPEWARGYVRTPFGYINLGAVDQMSVLAQEMQTALGIGSPTPVGVNRPINELLPGLQIGIELAQSRNRYGRESNWGSILRSDFPVPSWMSAFYRDPSALYTGRTKFDALLRSLRLAPFGIDESYGTGQQ